MNEFGKYRLFRKYASLDGVNYTPLDEYQALLVENNTCQCGYREFEYRFDGEYKEETFKKYEIWNEYSFCPTDSSYDELTGKVDYRNPIAADGVILATYLGNGKNSVKLCTSSSFYEKIAINNNELEKKYTEYTFNNTDINEVEYSNVTSIGISAFTYCNRLESIIIPNTVKSIGSNAFSGCTSLTSVTIPDSVKIIGFSAFTNCTSLTSVTIPNSVTSIGNYAFSNCGLKSVTIPNSVTYMAIYAFAGCTSLTSVDIGNSVTSIREASFASCTSLTSVTIPNSVTSIGRYAFTYCSSLSSITCYATTSPSLGSKVFNNLPTNGTLYVPNGSDYSSWLSNLPSGWTIEYI